MEGLFSFRILACTVLFFIIIHLSPLSSVENKLFSSCGKSFNCANITEITYPFWGNDRPKECGYPGFELQCDDQEKTIIQIANINYLVLDINLDAQIITVTRKDLGIDGICQFNSTIDNSNTFEYASSLVNFTFDYACSPWIGSFNCPINGMNYKNSFTIGGEEGAGTCHASIVVPGRKELPSGGIIRDLGDLKQLLEQGFDVKWKVDTSHCKECEKFGGRCGFDAGANEFRCLCPDDQSSSSTSSSSSSSSSSSNNACINGLPFSGTEKSKPLSSLATPPGTFFRFPS
ncbi:hypothetical protein MTR67_010252 [Solanum verrucosum]|uniref:non-specific serine/threonine protein kinase n=1 Tax=Solanum verrucosum TaxID=315347 RepID=A0AAF0TE23_SOLVR|nr:hypothetical protein MTR67_010252 [Solanum verrucosum]